MKRGILPVMSAAAGAPSLWHWVLRAIGHQQWLRWSIRYRFLQFLPKENIMFAVPFLGKTYTGNFNNFIDRAVFFWDMHEREYVLAMLSLFNNESIVLDIGANVGHHALAFATVAKTVHAFEPYAPVADTLETRMQENSVTNVILHRIGLGAANAALPFYAPSGDNLGIGSFATWENTTNVPVGELPIQTGDAAIASLGLTHVDFIKIDVERLEKEILIGLQETFKKYQPIVEVEYTPDAFSSEEDFMRLLPGYAPYMMKVNRPFLYFFNRPRAILRPFTFDVPRAEVLLFPQKSGE